VVGNLDKLKEAGDVALEEFHLFYPQSLHGFVSMSLPHRDYELNSFNV
jgi:hypothetical protein